MLHRISAGAIVESEERVLLVRHQRPDRYDFWVAPGGGVKGDESLEDAAIREVREETGLHIAIDKLVYVEEFINPECRNIKFWFKAGVVGGTLDTNRPGAKAEYIVQACWASSAELMELKVFPPVLASSYWRDR